MYRPIISHVFLNDKFIKSVAFVKFNSFTNGDVRNKLYTTVNNYTIYYLSSFRAFE